MISTFRARLTRRVSLVLAAVSERLNRRRARILELDAIQKVSSIVTYMNLNMPRIYMALSLLLKR